MANRRKKGRALNGVLLLDKPIGASSNQVLQKVKWLYQAQKAGHTGTLDPDASGVLPICFGEATKFSQLLIDHSKGYLAQGTFGQITDTLDVQGSVLERFDLPEVNFDQFDQFLQSNFVGHLQQVPPMFSALKRDGVRLYELARKGKSVERPARKIEIVSIKLIALSMPNFLIQVHCSKGTYIRSLIDDIGRALGSGAVMSKLERNAHGRFTIQQTVQLSQLKQWHADGNIQSMDHILLPVDVLLQDLPKITLNAQLSPKFKCGNSVNFQSSLGLVRVYDECHQLLGLGIGQEGGQLQPKRLLQSGSSIET